MKIDKFGKNNHGIAVNVLFSNKNNQNMYIQPAGPSVM